MHLTSTQEELLFAPALQVIHPDNSVTLFSLEECERLTVGRHAAAGLKLQEARDISRIQLELVKEEPYFYLFNRSYTVATLLNGYSVPSQQKYPEPLHHNDRITIGAYTLIFIDQNDTVFHRRQTRPQPTAISHDQALPVKYEQNRAALQKGFIVKEDGTVLYRGKEAHLSPRLYHFLVCLYQSYPETCSNRDLEEKLSGSDINEDLYRLVTDLRNIFKSVWADNETEQPLIENIRKFGYRLVLK
ncbi:MAG TPA: FHA domain-containing protein [Chloroflexia bacterium]|nr:FHA domain-containing protein [Chloroflexia bacterium]